MKKESLFLILAIWLFAACTRTRDPDFVPDELYSEHDPPWEAPVYGPDELASFFANTDYRTLSSIYVATTGSDESGDGSQTAPYASIQHAKDQHPEPGTIIRVRAGRYTEKPRINVFATQAAPYVIYSEDGPGAAILDGQGEAEDIFRMTGQHIVLDGFEVTDTRGYAIAIFPDQDPGQDSWCVVRNVRVHRAGRDIIKSAQINFLLIENCDISICTNVIQNDNGIDGVGVYHTLCRNNYIHDVAPGHGGYFKSGSHNNIWHNNRFERIGNTAIRYTDGAGLQLGGTGQLSWRDDAFYEYPSGYEQLAFNNLFIDCAGGAVNIRSCWKTRVYNNSIFNCGYTDIQEKDISGKALIRIIPGRNLNSREIEIYNNIAFQDTDHPTETFYLDMDAKFSTGEVLHGYNTVWNSGAALDWNWPDGLPNEDRVEQFAYLDDSLEVAPGSPVVNSGFANPYVTFDYTGRSRPVGIIDRGAYEQ